MRGAVVVYVPKPLTATDSTFRRNTPVGARVGRRIGGAGKWVQMWQEVMAARMVIYACKAGGTAFSSRQGDGGQGGEGGAGVSPGRWDGETAVAAETAVRDRAADCGADGTAEMTRVTVNDNLAEGGQEVRVPSGAGV